MYLRCSAGTVEWAYPTGALIVNLRPNTLSPSRPLTLCIKPLRNSSGASIYLEKTGELRLLLRDGDPGPSRAPCFGLEQGGLFVEATPQQDIGRRTTGFQYELTSRRAGPDLHGLSGECGASARWLGVSRPPQDSLGPRPGGSASGRLRGPPGEQLLPVGVPWVPWAACTREMTSPDADVRFLPALVMT